MPKQYADRKDEYQKKYFMKKYSDADETVLNQKREQFLKALSYLDELSKKYDNNVSKD